MSDVLGQEISHQLRPVCGTIPWFVAELKYDDPSGTVDVFLANAAGGKASRFLFIAVELNLQLETQRCLRQLRPQAPSSQHENRSANPKKNRTVREWRPCVRLAQYDRDG
jgi:hypothetical protein